MGHELPCRDTDGSGGFSPVSGPPGPRLSYPDRANSGRHRALRQDNVHQAYVAMAASGVVTEAQRLVFNTVSQKLLKEKGAEAIMLGGTDLALAFNQQDTAFPLVDCAGIHVDAIVRLAIS